MNPFIEQIKMLNEELIVLLHKHQVLKSTLSNLELENENLKNQLHVRNEQIGQLHKQAVENEFALEIKNFDKNLLQQQLNQYIAKIGEMVSDLEKQLQFWSE